MEPYVAALQISTMETLLSTAIDAIWALIECTLTRAGPYSVMHPEIHLDSLWAETALPFIKGNQQFGRPSEQFSLVQIERQGSSYI